MIQNNEILRIGIVYDGSYFARISDHYAYEHPRSARINVNGLHEFIRQKIAERENADPNVCRIVEAHYFRGRYPAEEAEKRGNLAGDRIFEDVLIRAGITPHFLLLAKDGSGESAREKGIDVWLALEAYELASVKRCNAIVLISGDGDQLQLVRKLNSLGTRVMVLAWDISNEAGTSQTRTSQALIDAATYSIEMAPLIDGREHNPLIDGIFMTKRKQEPPVEPKPGPGFGATPRRTVTGRNIWNPSDQEIGEIQYGKIINLPHSQKYGFIQPDGGEENIFFHFSAVDDTSFIVLNARVSYKIGVNPSSGKLMATDITRYPGD